jgi:hypothetical protein
VANQDIDDVTAGDNNKEEDEEEDKLHHSEARATEEEKEEANAEVNAEAEPLEEAVIGAAEEVDEVATIEAIIRQQQMRITKERRRR